MCFCFWLYPLLPMLSSAKEIFFWAARFQLCCKIVITILQALRQAYRQQFQYISIDRLFSQWEDCSWSSNKLLNESPKRDLQSSDRSYNASANKLVRDYSLCQVLPTGYKFNLLWITGWHFFHEGQFHSNRPWNDNGGIELFSWRKFQTHFYFLSFTQVGHWS